MVEVVGARSTISSYHILKSFGATMTIFSFLQPQEVVCLQLLNRWMYSAGVPRAQPWLRLDTFDDYFFTVPRRAESAHTLYRYKVSTGEATSLSAETVFDFKKQQSVQLVRYLYSVSEESLQVTKYDMLGAWDPTRISKSLVSRATLGSIANFSLAAY